MMMRATRCWLLLLVTVSYLSSDAYSMAVSSKGCKVCTAKTCKANGSGLLLTAMKSLAPKGMAITGERCLNICAPRGIVVRPSGEKTKTVNGPLLDKKAAETAAKKLLREIK
jgi:hypothetical protein